MTGCKQLPHELVLTFFFSICLLILWPLLLFLLDSSPLYYLCQLFNLMTSLSCYLGFRYILFAANVLMSSVPINIRAPLLPFFPSIQSLTWASLTHCQPISVEAIIAPYYLPWSHLWLTSPHHFNSVSHAGPMMILWGSLFYLRHDTSLHNHKGKW
jgi:hypothetical protein